MMHEKLNKALDEVSDNYLAEAINAKRKRPHFPWLGALAAALAVVILAAGLWRPLSSAYIPETTTPSIFPLPGTPTMPQEVDPPISSGAHHPFALAAPVYPTMCSYPIDYDFDSYSQWRTDQKAMHDQPAGYASNLRSYFAQSVPLLLTDTSEENPVCSPLNIYMALAMLAETTDGESRQQILDLLNAESIEALRTQAGQVWRAHYNDDGLSTSILGSSLWVDEAYTCNEQTAKLLAEYYYASVFSGDLGSAEMDEALQSWLSEQTGGLLDGYIQEVKLNPRTSLVLASTLYYQVQWEGGFSAEQNTEGVFHGTSGDATKTFMNCSILYDPYYWGDRFGAVSLQLEDGSRMWLFLPDEGVSPEQLMEDGDIFDFLKQSSSTYPNQKRLIINLSLPKFDIAAKTQLKEQLQTLGVTDVFEVGIADFSPILAEDDGGFVSEIEHAARVAVDEDGVTAAAYTLILRDATAPLPPEEEIDFVLDRPFAFVIESQDCLPLFAGIVNQP